jgi:hypothetical protein
VALERTQGWHEPVQTLIRATPAASIWGTLLQDQDPVALQEHLLTQHPNCQRVILAGDALHAMSPFKGQGANQALQDGVVIASWLSKASLSSAVTGCMREMVQRTAPVIAASRQAAKFWHSVEALQVNHKFAGVGDASKLLQLLRLRSVNAETENLDDAIRIVVAELGISYNKDDNENGKTSKVNGADRSSLGARALQAASTGATGVLRQISWEYPNFIRQVTCTRDGNTISAATCLHAASINGHAKTVHWLVTEAGCCTRQTNIAGQTAWDVAAPSVRDLLQQLQQHDGSWG